MTAGFKKTDMNKKKDNSEEKMEKQQEKDQAEEQQAEIDEAKNKNDYDSLWDSYLRLQADFDNYKKRFFKERTDFIKFANEGLILELLGILDNFERGIKSAEQKKNYDLLHQGVDMISRQLHSLLREKGLQRIEVMGEKFDPHLHDALEVVESDAEEGIIVEELQPGYILNGRILRHAKVKVSKGKGEGNKE